VATGAASAWRALWTVPAAAPALHGVLIGFEQNEFGSVTTMLGAARFRLGVLWQLQFAQAQVSGVIDPDLLAQYPELATLRVMARFVSLDGVHTVGRTTVSAGLREESDELLGVSASGVTARSSVRLRLGYRTAIAGVFDETAPNVVGIPTPRLRSGFFRVGTQKQVVSNVIFVGGCSVWGASYGPILFDGNSHKTQILYPFLVLLRSLFFIEGRILGRLY